MTLSEIEQVPDDTIEALTVQNFQYNDSVDGPTTIPFTLYGTPEKPLFNAKEIGDILGIVNIHTSLKGIDNEDKVLRTKYTIRGKQRSTFLTEQGMYQLVFTSKKEIGKKLRKFAARLVEERRKEVYQLAQHNQEVARRNQELVEEKQKEIDILTRINEKTERMNKREETRKNVRNKPLQNLYIYGDNRNYLKVGMTKSETVTKRISNQKTSLPELKLLATYQCVDAVIVDKFVRGILRDYSVDPKYEFFDLEFQKIDKITRNVIFLFDSLLHHDHDATEIILLEELINSVGGWPRITDHSNEIELATQQLATLQITNNESDTSDSSDDSCSSDTDETEIDSEADSDSNSEQSSTTESEIDSEDSEDEETEDEHEEKIDDEKEEKEVEPPKTKKKIQLFSFQYDTSQNDQTADLTKLKERLSWFTNKAYFYLLKIKNKWRFEGFFGLNHRENLESLPEYLHFQLPLIRIEQGNKEADNVLNKDYDISTNKKYRVGESSTINGTDDYAMRMLASNPYQFKITRTIKNLPDFLGSAKKINGITFEENCAIIKYQDFENHLRYFGFRNLPSIEKLNAVCSRFKIDIIKVRLCHACNKIRNGTCCADFDHNKRKSARIVVGVKRLKKVI